MELGPSPFCITKLNDDVWKHSIMSYLTLQDLVAFTMTCKYTYNSKLLSHFVLRIRAVVSDGFLRWTQRTGCLLDGVSIAIDVSYVHTFDIYCACFSSNGELVVGSLDGTLSIWNTRNCIVTHQIVRVHQEDDVNAVYPLDDNRIVSCSNDGSIKIWNLNDNVTCEKVILAHKGYVSKIHVNNDGHLVSIGEDGWLKVWNLLTGECVCRSALHVHLDVIALDLTVVESGIYIVYTKGGEDRGIDNHCRLRCYDTSEQRLASGNTPFIPNNKAENGYRLLHVLVYCICALLDCDGFVIGYVPTGHDLNVTAKIGVYELTKVGSGHDNIEVQIESKMILEGNGTVISDITTTVMGNLVSCGYDGSIMLHRRVTNFCFEPARIFQVHKKQVNFVVSFPNGLGVVTGARDDRLCYTAIDEQAYVL